MPLVTSTEMFKKAYEGGYAIGAFNVNNMEIVQGITEAAKELSAPLILQVSAGARKYANHTYLMKLVEAAVLETGLSACTLTTATGLTSARAVSTAASPP
jgi:fructose-bisphosphate aldolase class II